MDEVLIRMISILENRDDVQILATNIGPNKVTEALDSLERLAKTWLKRGLISAATLDEVTRIISDLRQDVKEI